MKPIAALIPQLYRAVRDRFSLQLIQTIGDKVRQTLDAPQFESSDGFTNCLNTICKLVGDTLKSFEVSIVLKDPQQQNQFGVKATTWEEGKLEAEHQTYQIDMESPLEGWKTDHKTASVIRHREPMLLFDIKRAIPSSASNKHPGLRLNLNDSFITHFKTNTKLDEAPISYIAVPVHYRGKTIGAIRCCGALSPPHYFSQRDLDLLQVIADQVAHLAGTRAHLAGTRAHLREADEQVKAVERFASGLSSLNSTIQNEIAQSRPNIETVIDEAIRQIQQMVPAYAIDFRRYNDEQRSLLFDKFGGLFWDNASPEKVKEFQQMAFPIDTAALPEKARSAGELALMTSSAYWAEEINKDRFFTIHGLFQGAKQALVVPVKAGTRNFGVLDLVYAADAPGLTNNWRKLFEIMGTQLGLYSSLIENRIAVDRSYEDLAHNLKGPLAQARDRADRMVAVAERGRQVPIGSLKAVRGLCRKALGVMRILAMSADFHSMRAIKLHTTELSVDRLIGLLNQAASDYELIYKSRSVTFHIDSRSVQSAFLNRPKSTDFELLEQAVFNVFDNAIKYSNPSTKIEVKALRLPTGEVGIEVANQGILLSTDDAKLCLDRGWRGEVAQKVTQDGSGLGLWLVDNILDRIYGRLDVRATDNQGWTRVRIILK